MSVNNNKLRPGPKKGGKRQDICNSTWYSLCKDYSENYKNVPQFQYLNTQNVCEKVRDSPSNRVSFSVHLKKFRAGLLQSIDSKRIRQRKFQAIEDKLIEYIDLRTQLYARDKCGVGWVNIEAKCKQWAAQAGIDDTFKASPGWISSVLKRNSRLGIHLHGEANDLSNEDRAEKMAPWRIQFHALLDEENIPPERVYNADQTGLFYNKMPNRIYVTKADRKNFAGVKQMKAKDRLTVMVCTAADGSKVPLSIIGKPKVPECFRYSLDDPSKPPLAYKDQANAWFDRDITIWWINHVFWPMHTQKFGQLKAILLLDNCAAHTKLDPTHLPKNLIIHFFPSNVTSLHQPADMGIIATMKVGYRTLMLTQLLDVFDAPNGFKNAEEVRRGRRRGCKGLDVGGKATILDAMMLLLQVWTDESKYATQESIRRCWRKADILPISWNTDIDRDVGSKSSPAKVRCISKEACMEICGLLTKLQVAHKHHHDHHHEGATNNAPVLENSLVTDHHPDTLSPVDQETIVRNWLLIEDDPVIQETEVEEAIDRLLVAVDAMSSAGTEEVSETNEENETEPAETASTISSNLEAEMLIQDIILYCKKRKFSDAITHLETASRKIRNAHIENQAKRATLATITNFFPPILSAKNTKLD